MQKGICFVSWVPPCQVQKILQINICLKELIHKIYTCMLIFVAGYPEFLYMVVKNNISQYCYRVYRLVSNGGGYKSITQKASHHLEKTSHTRAMLRPFARDTSRNILPNQTNTFLRPASPNPLLFHIRQVLKLILELL